MATFERPVEGKQEINEEESSLVLQISTTVVVLKVLPVLSL